MTVRCVPLVPAPYGTWVARLEGAFALGAVVLVVIHASRSPCPAAYGGATVNALGVGAFILLIPIGMTQEH